MDLIPVDRRAGARRRVGIVLELGGLVKVRPIALRSGLQVCWLPSTVRPAPVRSVTVTYEASRPCAPVMTRG